MPQALLRRRVEITGPVNNPKMVINMLTRNSAGQRADAAMLDFEDAMMPRWSNVVQGIENLVGAVDTSLTHSEPPRAGRPERHYRIDPADMPLLMVRVRGLHLDETNLRVDGRPVAAGLMDLTLSTLHTAHELIRQGKTPMYYVPKCEHYLEARWWNRLLELLESSLEITPGTLKVTFLIETLPAAFQVEEILYEIRAHAAGLNVGRWDKIFSDIKVLKEHPDRVLADRGTISMQRSWMKNYALQLIRVCHSHGALAIGGMAAFTPGGSQAAREEQTGKVIADKQLEASMGHDGCWVSHPYFIGPALAAFEQDNQRQLIPDIPEHPDLLPQGTGPRTLDGLRKNVRVGIAYMKGWNEGIGCIAWDDLMEDLATLEISRTQTWQWLHHRITLDDGSSVTRALVSRIFDEELERIEQEIRNALEESFLLENELDRYRRAAADAESIFLEKEYRSFLVDASPAATATSDDRPAANRGQQE